MSEKEIEERLEDQFEEESEKKYVETRWLKTKTFLTAKTRNVTRSHF
jgi:hypothetical protein